jgi:hypothetical protein
LARFQARTRHDAATGCILWTGSADSRGYGKFFIRDACYLAHRVAYTWRNGPIPDGLVIDHLCRVHLCVNPAHLEPVTTRENLLRGETHMAKTHCSAGHPLSGDNVRHHKDRRICRECEHRRAREWKARQRQ